MTRKPREYTESGCYHVFTKGSGNNLIFRDDKDRFVFVNYLRKYEEKFGIKVNCFALPDNHYHLHITDGRGVLSEFMHSLNSAFATYFNRHHAHTGCVFNGRFKSRPIKNELYFNSLFTYLGENITKHGLALNPLDYQWFFIRDEFAILLDMKKITSAFNEKPRVRPFSLSSLTNKIYVNMRSIRHYDVSSRKVPERIIDRMSSLVDELNCAKDDFMRYYLSPPSLARS